VPLTHAVPFASNTIAIPDFLKPIVLCRVLLGNYQDLSRSDQLPSLDTMAGAQPGSRKTPGSTSRRTANVKVVSSRRDFARSYAADWPPPVPATEEAKAIEDLKEEWAARSDDETVYDGYQNPRPMLMVDLHDFEIYRSPNTAKEARRHELISLHFKNVPTPKRLCFDGFLCLGGTRLYVKGVAIQDSSIEGYGNDQHPGVVAYLQSEVASKDQTHDVWYRLKKPSQAYAKFHEPYLSIAQLGKHALDFLEQRPPNSVELESFRIEFHAWLIQRFALPNTTLAKWHGELQNRIDFRVDINAYIDFFYSEACNLPNSEVLLDHPLWADCMVRGLTRVKKQDKIEELTVTTPEVYDMFKDTYFGKKLRSMPLAKSEKDQQARRKLELGFATTDPATGIAPTDPQYHPYGHLDIQIGDVVAFDPEEHDKTTWRNAEWEWLAYVQGVQPMETGGQRLFVLFLYRPRETNIFNAKYRFDSELFFSDNCNCGDGELLSTDIKGKYSIEWLPKKIDSSKGFFVRQTYLTENSAFVTFKDAHKICSCRKTAPINTYNCGETVYITKTVHGKPILEPVVVRHTNQTTGSVTVRKLLRLGRDCAQLAVEAKRTHIADNELVLTDEYLTVSAARIKRRCKIRFISKKDVLQGEIPLPYNRGGACDYFFVSMGISTFHGVSCLMYLSRLPERFNQDEGMGATVGVKKLRGLSMFSGGGNFDRGLEEGGAVEFRNAIDLDAHAIHTQRANAKDPSRLSLYYGSVDDYMRLALSGVEHTLVARIGDVQFIAAGTPCPGA
jgi:DNA (cytosine-5)-methyltransferase 1